MDDKTEVIHVRFDKKLMRLLRDRAVKERRPLSQLVRVLVEEELIRRGVK